MNKVQIPAAVNELRPGMMIRIRGLSVCEPYPDSITPQYARGRIGKIIRCNRKSVTVDLMDGFRLIYVDLRDVCIDEEKER